MTSNPGSYNDKIGEFMIDKFSLAYKIKKSKPVDKIEFIIDKCRNKKILDLGCIRHSAEFSLKDPDWLHKKILSVAEEAVGVDYLAEEIKKLNNYGYDIMYGDVTKPLNINKKFDIIIAGDLIEHLTNFEGFFLNCKNMLAENGILIITTPNPFYTDEYHYVAFKKNYLINPEHTCWIDPMCLNQLCSRFDFEIDMIYFIKKSWKLNGLICENENHFYDIFLDKWVNQNYSEFQKFFEKIIKGLFKFFYWPFKAITCCNSILVRYSDYLAVLKIKKILMK